VLTAVPGVAALRHPIPRRPALHDTRAVQGQGAQTRTPRHCRTPRPGLSEVVEQKPWMTTGTSAARSFGNSSPRLASSPRTAPKTSPTWERPAPTEPDVPSRPVLLLHAVAERQRWKAEYTAAQLVASGSPPDNRSAIEEAA
jgi:hypothetical protein